MEKLSFRAKRARVYNIKDAMNHLLGISSFGEFDKARFKL